MIRRSPNGETRAGTYLPACGEYIAMRQPTQGTETSKYLEEKKSTEIPLVVASERGTA